MVRQTNSTNVQYCAVKLLTFIVNDMLDYAQLSTGQFRKSQTKFNLVESVTDIIDVIGFKAKEYGIKL